jgi:hypothetical protein
LMWRSGGAATIELGHDVLDRGGKIPQEADRIVVAGVQRQPRDTRWLLCLFLSL